MSEHDLYDRFNDSIVPSANFAFLWRPLRSPSNNADARVRRQSRPYFMASLQGCLVSEAQKEELLYLIWRSRGVRPVLCRIPMFCEIGRLTTERDPQGHFIPEPIVIGTGDGTEDEYQLRKEISGVLRDDEPFYYDVTFPHTAEYGTQKNISDQNWRPLNPVQLWRKEAGVWYELASDLWSVDRSTGAVSATVLGELGATGGFYVLMLLPEPILFAGDSEHRGLYVITNEVSLAEPPGGK